GPLETWSVTSLPLRSVDPVAGSLEATLPSGTVEENTPRPSLTSRPALERRSRAWLSDTPSTCGTFVLCGTTNVHSAHAPATRAARARNHTNAFRNHGRDRRWRRRSEPSSASG